MSIRVPFARSLLSEIRKLRRSGLLALCISGALLVPALTSVVRLRQPRDRVLALVQSESYWEVLWNGQWESLAALFVPTGCIVIAAVVTAHEHRFGAWKQLHATPQSLGAIFGAKLAVATLALASTFLVYFVAFWCCGYLPVLLYPTPHTEVPPFPLATLAIRVGQFFVDALPIVTAQFALGLTARQVMIPVGAGLAGWMIALTSVGSGANWIMPYGYLALDFFNETGTRVSTAWPMPLFNMALTQSIVWAAVAWVRYRSRWEHL